MRLISVSFVLVQGLLPPPNSTSASASTKRRERTAKRVIASCTTWFPCIHTRTRFIVQGWWKPAGSIHNIAWWMRSLSLSLSSVDIYIRIIAFYGPFHHRGWRASALGDGTCTTTKIYLYIHNLKLYKMYVYMLIRFYIYICINTFIHMSIYTCNYNIHISIHTEHEAPPTDA